MAPPVALRAPCIAIYSGILSAVNSSIGMLFLTRGWVKFGLPRWVIFQLPFPRGFEYCDAQKIYRHFVRGKANIDIESGNITVTFPRKAHNPILRAVPWKSMPKSLSWMSGASLNLKFK
jgi:hypothetical protein